MFATLIINETPMFFGGWLKGKTYFFGFLMIHHLSNQSIIDGWLDVNSDIGIA